MFTLLDSKKHFFPNRHGTTQEGSQGLWDYPQPIPDASRDSNQHQKIIFFFESGTSNHYYQVKGVTLAIIFLFHDRFFL